MPTASNHITLHVEGLHCEGCARRLQCLLADTAGVQQANVQLHERRAEVWYDPRQTDLPTLAQRIRDAGFPPRPEHGVSEPG